MREECQAKYYSCCYEHARALAEQNSDSIFILCDCAGGRPLDISARPSEKSDLA